MREKLPARRASETFDFSHITPGGAPIPHKATLGLYPDGRTGEIFIGTGKVGTHVDVAVKDAAILASFALQYGAQVADMRAAMTRDAQGRPEGVMGTLLDLIYTREVNNADPHD